MFPIAALASLEDLFLTVHSCRLVWCYNCIFMTWSYQTSADPSLVGYELKPSSLNTSRFIPGVRWHRVGLAIGTSAGARNTIPIRKIWLFMVREVVKQFCILLCFQLVWSLEWAGKPIKEEGQDTNEEELQESGLEATRTNWNTHEPLPDASYFKHTTDLQETLAYSITFLTRHLAQLGAGEPKGRDLARRQRTVCLASAVCQQGTRHQQVPCDLQWQSHVPCTSLSQ